MPSKLKKVPGYSLDEKTFFVDLKVAQMAELEALFAVEEPKNSADIGRICVEKAAEVIDILTFDAGAKPAKKVNEYSDAEYAAASEETGIPQKILRQRVSTGGKTLSDARTTPYTPRTRKPSPAAVNAAVQDIDP